MSRDFVFYFFFFFFFFFAACYSSTKKHVFNQKVLIFYFSAKKHVVSTHLKCLSEALLSTFNIRFHGEVRKNFLIQWTLVRTTTFVPITKTRLFKYIETFTIKIWKFSDKKFWYFLYFSYVCSKHRLWVLVRTALMRQFLRVPTVYVFEHK